MFFRRKKRRQQELRRHYRRKPSKSDVLGVKLTLIDGRSASGDLLDASAGGLGVEFPGDKDPRLEIGEQLVLKLSSLHQSSQLQAGAIVRNRREAGGMVQYGLAFVDAEQVFDDLDPYFQRFLNRRNVVRVRPALDTKLIAELDHEGRREPLVVHDLSVAGVGLVVTAQHTVWIEGTQGFEVMIKLPKSAGEFRWPARRIHLTDLGSSHRAGLVFELDGVKGAEAQRDQLKVWIDQREAEMARWNAADG